MATKSGEAGRNKAIAGRIKHLRSGLFTTEGYKFDENPSLADARAMANRNRRAMAAQRPNPSVTG